MKIYGNLWKSMKIYENLWKSMEIDENRLKSMKTYENLWKSMKIYENLWKSMKIQGYMCSEKMTWVIFYILNIYMPHLSVLQRVYVYAEGPVLILFFQNKSIPYMYGFHRFS